MRRENCRLIADREHRIRLLINSCRNGRGDRLRLVQESHRDCVIGPWVVELIASVGRQQERCAGSPRGFAERPDLIARGGGEKENAFHT